jgi:selenocysteine-specific elongation factor
MERHGVILGTAGHIDHGKTTLVRCLTGVDTDRLPEEKKRGITIELGFAPLTLDGVGTIGVVDVPGHEAFVRTMVAGATGVDLALVVVAADEGIMPQTREHLTILELLGVRAGVVALTKSDLVDAEWLALVEEEVREATQRALPGAPIVATSAATGAGVAELRQILGELARSIGARNEDDLFRMPVDRVFSIRGTGTVVTGTVWSGRLARDETLRILPSGRSTRARTIQTHSAQVEAAVPGARAAVALAGVDVADAARGSVLVTDHAWRPTSLARADVVLTADAGIRPRTWLRFHIGTSEVGARVVTSAREPRANEWFAARVVLDEPVVLRAGDRFVLRTSAPLNTIGGGVITDPYAPRRAKSWPVHLDADQRLRQMIDESGAAGIDVRDLPVRLGTSPTQTTQLLGLLRETIVEHAGRLIAAAALRDIEARLDAAAAAHHSAFPLELGAPLQWVRSRLPAPPELIDLALSRRVAAGSLRVTGGNLALASWTPNATPEQASLADAILSRLAAAASEPPTVAELSALLGRYTEPVLLFLERQGDVTQVESGRYYTTSNLKQLVDTLRAGMADGTERTPSELRDLLGISRKFLIPFLEYCDAVGYTIRSGSGRTWRSK